MYTEIAANYVIPQSSTRVLRIKRPDGCNYKIIPGAGAILSIHGVARPFSFACTDKEDPWTFLIREVEGGEFNTQVRKLGAGDLIEVDDFFRYFDLEDHPEAYYFATGTGCAPFLSAVGTFEHMPRATFVGAKTPADLVKIHTTDMYFVSQVQRPSDAFHGHITDALVAFKVTPTAKYYICGLADMVRDVSAQLMARGATHDQICVELFYAKN